MAHRDSHEPDTDGRGQGPPGSAEDRSREVAALFREHNQLLVRFLRTRLGSEQEAREVAQEAYVRLLQLDRTGAVSFLRAYLFKVATNLASDRLRSRFRRGESEPLEMFDELQDNAEPERTAIADEQLALLAVALNELPARCRDAFVLYRYEEKTQVEIATQLGISERMVRNYLTRALLYCKLRVDGLSADGALAESKQ